MIFATTLTRSDYTALALYLAGAPGHPADDEFRRLTHKLMMHLRRGIFDGCGGHTHDLVSTSDSFLRQLAIDLDATKPARLTRTW
ncbi:hypothetical protein [Amycolatopsis sp. NPDC004079]|uniref:hypothetical protein n=1 Tax=Amycolatopsis sp. NPDC004079 TaxID=3154549 RepID=UPI0033A30DE0